MRPVLATLTLAVAATLSNRTSDSISFGACVESVNGLVDGQWVSVYKPEACIDIAYFLESGNDFGLVLPKIAYPLADQYRIEYVYDLCYIDASNTVARFARRKFNLGDPLHKRKQ